MLSRNFKTILKCTSFLHLKTINKGNTQMQLFAPCSANELHPGIKCQINHLKFEICIKFKPLFMRNKRKMHQSLSSTSKFEHTIYWLQNDSLYALWNLLVVLTLDWSFLPSHSDSINSSSIWGQKNECLLPIRPMIGWVRTLRSMCFSHKHLWKIGGAE